MTDFQATYYAKLLTLRGNRQGVERLARSISSANIDLMPHQVEAALFAYRSPLSQGVLLADEVGLGKTIEAGLIISQHWNDGNRNILVIVPASLRKQWAKELKEKFFLDSIIIDKDKYITELKKGNSHPLIQPEKIVICSYNFAAKYSTDIRFAGFRLAILDEAHKIRNIWQKKGALIAKSIYESLRGTKKILLTATPLQNNLDELVGILHFIDDGIDPSEIGYKDCTNDSCGLNITPTAYEYLKSRLKDLCYRTLRSDVMEYVHYTERKSIVHLFTQSTEENDLYSRVILLIENENSHIFHKKTKSLHLVMALKLLSSSPKAIIGFFESILAGNISFDDEDNEPIELVDDELSKIQKIIELAKDIGIDSKLLSLTKALEVGFTQQKELGAPQKVLIFTEYKHTQNHIKEYLESCDYKGKIVIFNGTNDSLESKEIYNNWIEKHRGSDIISGVKDADMRQSLVDYFKNEAIIMIATEAGGEGINLQFCNLIVNYDMPWNPQRIEQRIGRCHRYGQEYDVIVINFLNKENMIDKKVYSLLEFKFELFNGVFGSSNAILNTLEDNIDIEKRIQDIYLNARTDKEIESYFDELDRDMDEKVRYELDSAQSKLLETFNIDVKNRLKNRNEESNIAISRYEKIFWNLSKYILKNKASVDDTNKIIYLQEPINEEISLGAYQLLERENEYEYHLLRQDSPLGNYIIEEVDKYDLNPKKLIFKLDSSLKHSSSLISLVGKNGWLKCSLMTAHRFEAEEYLLLVAIDDGYEAIDSNIVKQLFELPVIEVVDTSPSKSILQDLDDIEDDAIYSILDQIDETNKMHLTKEMSRLDYLLNIQINIAEEEYEKEKKTLKKKLSNLQYIETKKRQKIEEQIAKIEADLHTKKHTFHQEKDKKLEAINSNLQDEYEKKNLFVIEWELC